MKYSAEHSVTADVIKGVEYVVIAPFIAAYVVFESVSGFGIQL